MGIVYPCLFIYYYHPISNMLLGYLFIYNRMTKSALHTQWPTSRTWYDYVPGRSLGYNLIPSPYTAERVSFSTAGTDPRWPMIMGMLGQKGYLLMPYVICKTVGERGRNDMWYFAKSWIYKEGDLMTTRHRQRKCLVLKELKKGVFNLF